MLTNDAENSDLITEINYIFIFKKKTAIFKLQ